MRKLIVVPLAAVFILSACGSADDGNSPAEPEGTQQTETVDSDAVAEPDQQTPVEAEPADDAPRRMSAASAYPRIPMFNAICGTGIEVHGDEGGPVFIDGEETRLERFNDNYFEASHDGVTISISFNPDGSLGLSFTGPNRANGICTLQ